MSAMSFLQRIALAASAGRPRTTRAAPAGALTLGRLVHRRRLRLARLPARGAELATAEPPQLNDAWPEAGPGPAHEAPKLASVVFEPREVAGNSEPGDVSTKRLQREVPEVSRESRERIESGQPVGRAERSVLDTVAKGQSDTGQPAIDAAPADPPSHRPATLHSSLAGAGRLARKHVARAAEEAAKPEEELEDETPSVARVLARASAEAVPEELEEQQEEAPAVARAIPATPFAPGPVSPAGPAAPAAAAHAAPQGPSARDREAHAADFPAAPDAPGESPFEQSAEVPAAFLGAPQAPEPARAHAAGSETIVHIGSIEVLIEAPAPVPRSAGAPAAPPAGLASRLYLRGL